MNDYFLLKALSSVLFWSWKKNLVESSSMELLANVTAANFFHIWLTKISKYIYLSVHTYIQYICETTTHFMQEGNVAFTSFNKLFTK